MLFTLLKIACLMTSLAILGCADGIKDKKTCNDEQENPIYNAILQNDGQNQFFLPYFRNRRHPTNKFDDEFRLTGLSN